MKSQKRTLEYLREDVKPFLDKLVVDVCMQKPDDPVIGLVQILLEKPHSETKPLTTEEIEELETLREEYSKLRNQSEEAESSELALSRPSPA
ncbi:unnamed protein product [Moneuplotes crassus]|uniref:Uncharacterized protein n=1 Tax=Euplotes crassus TaxID=5936 RepID=A0AAD1Y2I2_EUPCR|nr:unnamed protein product [Moneuplotes crassus]